MRRPIRVETTMTVPYTPEQLWRYVADTQRMDRAVGLPRAHFIRVPRPEGGEVVTGEYRLGKRLVYARWLEHPFVWERPRHYSIVREYVRGPIVHFHGGAELEPIAPENGSGERTSIRVYGEFTPRHSIAGPFIRWGVGRRAMRRSRQQYEAIAAYIAGQTARPYVNPPRLGLRAGCVPAERLVERLERAGIAADLAGHLARWLAEMDDEDVAGMRPIELAHDWGTDERATIETFLRATTAGVLEMRWELLCPSCRGVKAEAVHLKDLAGEGYCPACNMPFSANVDEAIEARFYPSPSVRRAEVGSYCVGSPMDTPHRLAQATVPPGKEANWRLRLQPGAYTIRSPQSRGVARINVGHDPHDTRTTLTIEPAAIRPEQIDLAAGDVTIRLVNQTPHTLTAVLDDTRWVRLALTPGTLMTLPAFRALFSVEALAAGVELSITRVGLLFTDLAGSTALYERAGEARAFRLVGEHFEILQSAIEASGGAVVKTIGDAVMGAFPDGETALQAAIAIQQAIHALDTGDLADPSTLLKIGVHAGPCYVVTLNNRLDYFGAAVNLAARAQHEARGGQIVATAGVYEATPYLVTTAGLAADSFEVTLRGISAPVRLYRIDCANRFAPRGDGARSSSVTTVQPEQGEAMPLSLPER